MNKYFLGLGLSFLLGICGCTIMTVNSNMVYEDLTENASRETVLEPGKVYRLGETGICGTAEKENMTVTHIIPGSPADGKIQIGDILCGMQHRGMWARGGSLAATAKLRLYRVGRDWDWHFYVTVERPSLRNGKGNTVTYDLHMPPAPGNICHYGPTGFFAERHSDHLVVDTIEKDSPSDGKLMKGDIILSVGGKPITGDAYNLFTQAIDHAESPEGKGKLRLRVRRTGELPEGSTATKIQTKKKKTQKPQNKLEEPENQKELDVVLNLNILGRCSKTAPVECPKTDVMITQTADSIVKNRKFDRLHWDLLGLLATGEDKYIKVVRDILHDPKSFAKPPENPNELLKSRMYVAWDWGYRNLLLTEYYLLTGDKYVLPAITQLSRSLAAGQDQAGLWGHQMANPKSGRAYGYGVMNQPSLSIFLSLILSEKCGVKDKLVRNAIKRTHEHYKKFIGRGSLPYGNHGPGMHFTNNGTSGSLAIAFALLNNKKGASFFGAMSAAAANDEILLGHGGPRWNVLWSGLGANVLGPEMASAYNNKLHWLNTVTRKWDGRYTNIKGWGMDPKSDESGSHLLNLCTGRRKIHITGKGMPSSLWVNKEEAEKIVEAANFDKSNNKGLLDLLGSQFPPVRNMAARELAMKDAQVTDEVMKLLSEGTRNQKVGAVHAIQALKIENVVDPLLSVAMNEKEDLWVRILAVKALGTMNDAKVHAPELLKILVKEKPYDTFGDLDISLGNALVKLYSPDPYATDLDKDLFYRGVIKLLNHKHSSGRSAGMNLIKNIPREDLGLVIDKMVYLIEDKDKTYTSYTDAGRQEALEILYKHGVKESMDYTVNTLKQGRSYQKRSRMRLLKTFGGEAKYLIPRIKEILGKNADPIVKQIETSPTTKKMIPLKEVKGNDANK